MERSYRRRQAGDIESFDSPFEMNQDSRLVLVVVHTWGAPSPASIPLKVRYKIGATKYLILMTLLG